MQIEGAGHHNWEMVQSNKQIFSKKEKKRAIITDPTDIKKIIWANINIWEFR